MQRILREPLVHFLALGFLLFLAYGLVNDKGSDEDAARAIEIRTADLDRVSSLWSERWRRDPTTSELRAMIDDLIREEVLYREALDLGLEENDVIIRRRLAQKITFLTQDLAAQLEPDEDELRTWFGENSDIYREDDLLTFTHVYFSEDERGGNAQTDAQALLDEWSASSAPPERAPERGDRFMLRNDYRNMSPFEVRREFGTAFGDIVAELEPGPWHGPIRSGFGIHLVRLIQRVDGALPLFEEVRDRVEGDWLYEQNKRIDKAYYESLLEKYDLRMDESVRQIMDGEAE